MTSAIDAPRGSARFGQNTAVQLNERAEFFIRNIASRITERVAEANRVPQAPLFFYEASFGSPFTARHGRDPENGDGIKRWEHVCK